VCKNVLFCVNGFATGFAMKNYGDNKTIIAVIAGEKTHSAGASFGRI
jgi:hypothetical protein